MHVVFFKRVFNYGYYIKVDDFLLSFKDKGYGLLNFRFLDGCNK